MKGPKKNKKNKNTLQEAGIDLKDSNSSKKTKLTELQEELEKARTDYLYLKAEFENYKKQTLKEQSHWIRYGGESFILSLANEVVDDFERAFETYEKDDSLSDFKKGMNLVQKKLQKTLKSFSVTSIDPTGELFDPSQHEAIARQKNSQVPANQILFTLKKIYKLHDKIIRYGQVIISEEEAEENAADNAGH